jgi:hypothetical protein
MSVREKGLRRITAVTTGLVAASVAGTLAAAGLAWAHTEASRAAATATAGTSTATPGTTAGPALSTGDGAPHATSGGS